MKKEYPFVARFGFAVRFRAGRSGRWRELGRALTMREALMLCEGRGNFWIHALRDDSGEFVGNATAVESELDAA